MLRGAGVKSDEKEWEMSKKWSEWWSEETGVAVGEKRRAFAKWVQRRDKDSYGKYHAQRVGVKQAVEIVKEHEISNGMSDWGMIMKQAKLYFEKR